MKIIIISLCAFCLVIQGFGQSGEKNSSSAKEKTAQVVKKSGSTRSIAGGVFMLLGVVTAAGSIIYTKTHKGDPSIYPEQYKSYDDYLEAIRKKQKAHKTKDLMAIRINILGLTLLLAGLYLLI